MTPSFFSAVHLLVGGGVTGPNDGPISEYTFQEGQTPPTKAEVDAKLAELQTEYDAQKYARDRKAEYDALNQLEMQYDDEEDGTTTWKDAIKAIKTKYPKG